MANNLFFINPLNPTVWNLAIPEQEKELLNIVKIFKSYIVASYKKGPTHLLRVYPLEGNKSISGINLPLGYSVSKIQGFKNGDSFYFDLGSIFHPNVTYEYSYKKSTFAPATSVLLNYDYKNIEYIYKEVEAKDGKKIPVLLCKKKTTLLLDTPTLLESYGGYGISFENNFDFTLVDFIEKGGLYVRAYIRGGGELGEEWHQDGSGINKSNTFNDFISVAKFLVENKYTNSSKLAIKGGSHGGLVAAVAYTKQPKLFKAAICSAAPFDIVGLLADKNSKFQFNEYGDLSNVNELDSLIKYNPYYSLEDSVNYPSLFVYAPQKDERVPFANQAKFVAALQNRKSQKKPILLYLEKDAGHFGAVNTYEDAMKKLIVKSKFLYKELGME